jgi:hypothetical protein
VVSPPSLDLTQSSPYKGEVKTNCKKENQDQIPLLNKEGLGEVFSNIKKMKIEKIFKTPLNH